MNTKPIAKIALAALCLGTLSLTLNFTRNENVDFISFEDLSSIFKSKYDFLGRITYFDENINPTLLSSLNKLEVEEVALSAFKPLHQERLKKLIPDIFLLSKKYHVDPLWIISIMHVESGFNPNAISVVRAKGLMQVKPETAQEVLAKIDQKLSMKEVIERLFKPKDNIEVGIIYLKHLLDIFDNDYELATAAYNLGPNGLKRKITEGNFNIRNISYLIKVKHSYKRLQNVYTKYLVYRKKNDFESYAYSLSVMLSSVFTEDNLNNSSDNLTKLN